MTITEDEKRARATALADARRAETEAKELSPEAKAALGRVFEQSTEIIKRAYPYSQGPTIDKDGLIRELQDENTRLRKCLEIARTALLNIERRSEEARTALSKAAGEAFAGG